MSLLKKKPIIQEIRDDIGRIQEMLKGRTDVLDAWLELQKVWSKLANIDTLGSELLVNVNKKILELSQEKESLEDVMNTTNVRPNQYYGEICAKLKLLQEISR